MEIAFLILAHCFTSTIQVDNVFYTCLSIDISFYSIGANGSSVSFLYPEPLNVAISSGFIRDIYFAVGKPFMAEYFPCFGIKESFAFGFEEVDIGSDGQCQPGMTVGSCRKRQVGQRKDGTSLADTATVQVHRFYLHTGFGITIARFQ
jgi:hypothetical protein